MTGGPSRRVFFDPTFGVTDVGIGRFCHFCWAAEDLVRQSRSVRFYRLTVSGDDILSPLRMPPAFVPDLPGRFPPWLGAPATAPLFRLQTKKSATEQCYAVPKPRARALK